MVSILANVFSMSINVGGSGAKLLVLTFQIGDAAPAHYDLLQLLLVLGISIVAAVLVERLIWRSTPGGLLGAFIVSLIGIWVFITFIPLVWSGDVLVDGIPLITALLGAAISLLVVNLIFGGFRHRRPVAAA